MNFLLNTTDIMIAETTSASTHSCKGIYESICQVEFLRVPIRTGKVLYSFQNPYPSKSLGHCTSYHRIKYALYTR